MGSNASAAETASSSHGCAGATAPLPPPAHTSQQPHARDKGAWEYRFFARLSTSASGSAESLHDSLDRACALTGVDLSGKSRFIERPLNMI
jgi:hypothetical protein